jgi:hypothetical protein
LRLGVYTGSEEDPLLTGLTTTTSSVSTSDVGAYQNALDKLSNTSNPANQFDSSSQQDDTYTTTPSAPIASVKNGALIFSHEDLNENIKGAALQKFGKGHTTEVSTADASYKVLAGQYTLAAANGVSISGGTQAAPANVSITAGGYIKQTAYGPLDQITFGMTRKQFIGSAFSFFLGDNWSCTMGMTTSLTMGLSTSCFIGISITLKLSLDFSLAASATVTIKFFAVNQLTIGNKIDIVVGNDFKQVTGPSTKIVIGPDSKWAASDMKILTGMDIKMAPGGDIKKVGLNGTWCTVDVKVTDADIKANKLSVGQKNLMTEMHGVRIASGTAEVKSKASILHL